MVWALIVNDVRALVALLDRHGVAVGAAASVIGVFLTFAYLIATFSLVRQTRRAHIDAMKPLLSVRMIVDKNLFQIFNLQIENVGGGSARHIILKVNNPPLRKPVNV